MAKQDPRQIEQLVQRLEAHSKKGGGGGKKGEKGSFSCRKSTFAVEGSKDNLKVDSWKFRDWDYKRDDLPTYARGLFTTQTRDHGPEIAVRGYDKFFNVDEVVTTRWRNIENNTRGPYELSVKENGCIIFISGMEDGTLLVCSKHSTGSRADGVSHAVVGKQWVNKHVASVGRREQELASTLREMNATVVGELCDDNFEEHVLAYTEADAGIYLHGINFNVPQFATLSGSEVHKFADEWGFRKAAYVSKHNVSDVKTFLEGCAETGSWDGRDTEGFVIRCQMREHGVGPYIDWFFKYKFEEPYLMYRQWREATKALIAGKPPKYKKHVKITDEYLHYAKRQLAQNPKLAKAYNQNHGIIAMRDGFLKERGLKGSEIIAMEAAQGDTAPQASSNIVLVPIASIGCGKTTVALGLVKLFGWGHVQNDNIQGKKDRARRFVQQITFGLADSKAVIADRNNHQRRERAQIIKDVRGIIPNARFVALHYVHEPKGKMIDQIREVTRQRVLDRGDNHQTIRAATQGSQEVTSIMEGFLKRFEGADPGSEPDSDFDEIIDLDVAASSRENLETAVKALRSNYPKLFDGEEPTAADLDKAIDAAMQDYSVDVKHDLSFGNKNKKWTAKQSNAAQPIMSRDSPETLVKRVEYFNIAVNTNEVISVLSSLFGIDTPPEKAKLYNHLRNTRRVQPNFHVTLIHKALSKQREDIWTHYTNLYHEALIKQVDGGNSNNNTNGQSQTPSLGSARVRLERLVWDHRIMAFVVRVQPADEQQPADWQCANSIPHITIGTAAQDVKPKESNDLLQRWLEKGASPETGVWEAEVPSVKVLDGTVAAVLSRR